MAEKPTHDGDERMIDRRRMMEMLGAGGIIAIAGCSEGETTTEDDGGMDTTEGDGDMDSPDSIQFLTMGVGDNIQSFFDENNAAFEEEFGVDMEFTSVTWGNAKQTVNNRVDGNQAPDVGRWPARWIPQMVGKEALEPLDDLMQGDFYDKFYEGMAEGCKYEGSYYGVPWAASNKCFYYNKDIFESAGLDPENPNLNSWQDMLEAAKQIRDSDSVTKPALGLAGADAIETGSQYYHYHWSYGADLVDDEGNPVVNTSEGADALGFYAGLANEHNVTQTSPLSSTRQDVRQLFESGELGMVIAHVYAGLNIEDSDADFDYGITQVPKGPEGRYSLNTIDSVAVFSQTEVKDLAYDLIRFYFDEDRRFEYSSQKGFMPVTKAVGERDYFQDSKNWKPFIEAGQYARARPKLSKFSQFNNRMVQAIQEAVGGQKEPQKALDDAQADLEEMMA